MRRPILIGCGVILLGLLALAGWLWFTAGESKQAAEAIANKLYQALAAGDTDSAIALYGPEFFGKITKEQWKQMLNALQEKLGKYQSHELKTWKYHTRAGTSGSRRVVTLEYRVQYAKHEASETLSFFADSAGDLRLVGHNIQSAGLLLPEK